MNAIGQALLISGVTLGGGFVTFLLGQIALKLIDAANELRSLIAEIDCDLTLYLLDRHVAKPEERYRIFRRHGARLQAMASKIIGYSYFEDLFGLPPRKDVLKAARELLDLAIRDSDAEAAAFTIDRVFDKRDEIRKLLRLGPRTIEH
jgi:hypothetical protein